MNVGELILQLEEADPETPVRIASQPSWPMEDEINYGMIVETRR